MHETRWTVCGTYVSSRIRIYQRIYLECLEGASLLQIARGLEADGILTAANKPKWRPETLKKILQNEKYIGDALLQKTYTVDFLSKKRVVNNGKADYNNVADEIYRLRELKQNTLAQNAERQGKRQRIEGMTDFLNDQSCEVEEYDEQLVRRLIEKVTIFDDKVTVEFKSKVEFDVEI